MTDVAEIGLLGGSRRHALLEDARTVEIDTPYGPLPPDLQPDPALP